MNHLTSNTLPQPESNRKTWPWAIKTLEKTQVSDLPRVTIVTPSFNQERFLEETIRSVLLQGYPNLEYIVVDGGSTDNSRDIINKYEPWLTNWVSEPDNGQASAINKGFRESTGQIMGWLNSDDCLKPGALWHMVTAFQQNPDWQIVCGFREAIDANSQHLDYVAYLKPDRFSFSRTCYVPQESIFWRRSVWESVGELDESYQFALDYDFWQRCMAAGYKFHLIPKFLGMFRLHPDTKNTRWVGVRAREVAKIYRQYLNTEKSEEELRREIHPRWWRRMRMMTGLARSPLLHVPALAQVVVNILTLSEKDVVNLEMAS
jgi:glycosyltransferase involved in cell wall biosynthesis